MNALQVLTQKLAATLDMGEGNDLVQVLKATAFKGNVTDAQMTALMVVANQYKLNPWTREIYAFPDSRNGIVPIVGIDGWARIINSDLQFDGMEFEQDEESCTCVIYRKDRAHPVKVTEWLSECKRNTDPWRSHPKRMLRHKAMIQCARIAMGFAGIFDQDEAERIVEGEIDITPKESVKHEPSVLSPEQVTELRGYLKELEINEDGYVRKLTDGVSSGFEMVTTSNFARAQKHLLGLLAKKANDNSIIEGEVQQ